MRFFRREVWSYAVLLVILFCIASLATRATISHIESLIPDAEVGIASALVWSLTLGFMLIAGAFGLWAIKFSAESESRRRIGRFVDAMDYLSDGLLVVDRKGRITGSNPAAARLARSNPAERESIRDLQPSLSADDLSLLLDAREPNEVEREVRTDTESRLLRFRSQPSDDLIIIVISDITQMNAQRLHSRQMARLQLVGQLARGVAHDLNNLFSGIAGHASLLLRLRPGAAETSRSLESISQASEQGVTLAGHLMDLGHPAAMRASTDALGEHVATAVSILRDALPVDWTVEDFKQEEIPPVSLSGIQVEQMILNLGLLAAEAVGRPGVLRVEAGPPGTRPLFNVGHGFAGVILITAGRRDSPMILPSAEQAMTETPQESGVIQSVIRSMIEEAGGALYSFTGPDQSVIYRLAIPRRAFTIKGEVTGLPDEVKAYLAHWNVLFARPARDYAGLDHRLTELGVRVIPVDSVITALARVEEDRNLDVMILDKYLLGQEAKGLLKAILKLQPAAGIVVLCDDPASESEGLTPDVVFVEARSDPNKALIAMVEARNQALRRKSARKPSGA